VDKKSLRAFDSKEETLLDVVDSLIDKGVAVDAEVVLGVADIDLIYLRVGLLLAAADRVLDSPPERRRKRQKRGLISLKPPPGQVPSPVTSTAARGPVMARNLRIDDAAAVAHAAPAVPGGTGVKDDTSRSVIKLVLTLIDFVRQLLERQAVRRVEAGTLNPTEVERLGTALMQLEQMVHKLATQHDIDPSDLTLEVGPLGRLK
jgi:hypothetical protein